MRFNHGVASFAFLAAVAYASAADAQTEASAIDRPEFVPTKIKAEFIEQFTGDWVNRWSASAATKENEQKESFAYGGQWSVEEPSVFPGFVGDEGLVAKTKAAHHAISAQFPKAIDPAGKGLVIQYEVKLQKGLDCGGAYLKVLSESSEGIHAAEFSDKTPYTIMFGPDKCGATNKVHFIFRLKNPITGQFEEKHLKSAPSIKTTKSTALYTLIITSDDKYEILVNDESVRNGSLFDDFEPSVNPEKLIDDPEDEKPESWVDDKEMVDVNDVKPADWDESAPAEIVDEDAVMPEGWLVDEPATVPDPDAVKPEEWDDEEDGDWIAPRIQNPLSQTAPGVGPWSKPIIKNPNHKGKWYPAKIPNPDYIGEWAPKKIANPDYYEVKNPSSLNPIAGLGFEIWTMSEDILFDNIFIGHSASDAKKFAAETFHAKLEIEKLAEGSSNEDDIFDSVAPDWKSQPLAFANAKFSAFVQDASKDPLEALKAHPATAGAMATVVAALTSLIAMIVSSLSGAAKPAVQNAKKQAKDVKKTLQEAASNLPSAEELKDTVQAKIVEIKEDAEATVSEIKQRTTRSSAKLQENSD